MKLSSRIQRTLILTVVVMLMIMACEEEPVSIYDPDVTGGATPVVSMVTPDSNFTSDGIAFSGIGVMTITGENFSAVPDFNVVFFNGLQAEVLSASATQLRVRVPDIAGDSLVVRVGVQDAFQFGEYANLVELTPAVEEIGGFDDLDQLYSIACDPADALWITTFGSPTIKMYSVYPDSLKKLEFNTLTVSSTGMKYGGGDNLFLTGGALLYAMNTATGSFDPNYLYPMAGADVTTDVDFLEASYSIVSLKKSPNFGFVLGIDTDAGTVDTLAAYDSLTIAAVRVYDNAVYVAGSRTVDGVNTGSVVYKNTATGRDLGAAELILDLGDYPDYAEAQITALTFSADGKMYLGLNSVSAILQFANGELKPFYDPILTPPTKDLTWGNGNYLYQLKTSRLTEINMGEAGAPYVGRGN